MTNKKGFTFVEIIVAMIIIAIVAVSSLEFFYFCQKFFITPIKPKFMASNLARETMESLYWQLGSSLADTQEPEAVALPDWDPGFNDYLGDWTMTYTVSTPAGNKGYKKIEVTIEK